MILYCTSQWFCLQNVLFCRVVGKFDLGSNQLQCVSVRHATEDERSFAFKMIEKCNTILHRFDILRNEL